MLTIIGKVLKESRWGLTRHIVAINISRLEFLTICRVIRRLQYQSKSSVFDLNVEFFLPYLFLITRWSLNRTRRTVK